MRFHPARGTGDGKLRLPTPDPLADIAALDLMVLGAWAAAGLLVALLRFSWMPRAR